MAEAERGVIEVRCPRCGQKMRVQTFASINRQEDRDAAQRLLEGTLFDVTCGECGAVVELDYPVLYHDMEHHGMVQYVTAPSDVVRATEAFQRLLSGGQDPKLGDVVARAYSLRVVGDHNLLREKALVFEAGLDDRVVEVAKTVALYQLEGAEAARTAQAYFDGTGEDGSVAVSAFVGGEAREIELPRQLMDQVAGGMDQNRNADGFRIDRAWAVRALGIGGEDE